MKVFQKALLVSVLSLGVSYPSVAADTNPASQALMVSMSADIKSLQEKNQRLEHENFKLQTQILDLTRTAPEKQASSSRSLRQDVQNLQATMKEMVAEQKKFHRDYLLLSLRHPDGMEERKVGKLLESLAELEDSPLEEKNK